MNKKQKTVLWVAAIPIIGAIGGRLYVAIMFGAWNLFLRRPLRTEMLHGYVVVVIIAGILIYAFRDKKPKLIINCPQCGRSLRGATEEMIGDTGLCPKCKVEFVIEPNNK